MKLLILSAVLFLTAVNHAAASGFEKPFVLAMDYSVLTRLAQNDSFNDARKVLNDEKPFEKEPAAAETIPANDAEKWEPVRDLKNKPRSVSGEASFNANDTLSIGAAAGYTFPEETDQNKIDKAYSLKINAEVAL